MSPEAVTAERIYLDLKAEILRGRYLPGIALNVRAIAGEHAMSISPVRDGLQRMLGERLLVARTGGGFECPRLSEEAARDLYHWHEQLVRWAIGGRCRRSATVDLLDEITRIDPDDTVGIASATAELFYRIGEASGSIEHMLAIRSAGERLHILRLHERALDNRKVELKRLAALAKGGQVVPLRRAISGYHQRRIRYLGKIVMIANRLP
ncbi:GntR family transcriptional regulator [Sphingomonas oryzagri]